MPDSAPSPTVHCRSLPIIVRDIGTATAALRILRLRQRGRAAMLRMITQTIDAQQAVLDRLYAEKRAAYAVAVHGPARTPRALFEHPFLGGPGDRILAQTG